MKRINHIYFGRALACVLLVAACASARLAAAMIGVNEEALKKQVKEIIVEKLFDSISSGSEAQLRDKSYLDEVLKDFNFLGVNMGEVNFSELIVGKYREYVEAAKKDAEAKEDEPRNNLRGFIKGEFTNLLLKQLDSPSQEIIGELQSLYGEAQDKLKALEDAAEALEDPDADYAEVLKKFGLKGTLIEDFEFLEVNIRAAMEKYGEYGDYYQIYKTVTQGLGARNPGDKIDALFSLGAEFGGKIPVLGKFIELYSKVAQEMIAAVGRLGEILRKRQGYCLGTGTTGHIPSKFVDERNRIFSETYPDIGTVCPAEKIGVYKDIYIDINSPATIFFWTGDGFTAGNPAHGGIGDVKALIAWLRGHKHESEAQDVGFLARAFNIPPGFSAREKRVREMALKIQAGVGALVRNLNLCSLEEKRRFLLEQGGLQPVIDGLEQNEEGIEHFPYVNEVVDKVIDDRIMKNESEFWYTCEKVSKQLQNLQVVQIEGKVVDAQGNGVSGMEVSLDPDAQVLERCSKKTTAGGDFFVTLFKKRGESLAITLQARDETRASEEKTLTIEGEKRIYPCTLKVEGGELKNLFISPDEATVQVDESVTFKVTAEYEDGRVEPLAADAVAFSGAPGGVFKAGKAGNFTVVATYMEKSARAGVTVVDKEHVCPENEEWNEETAKCECVPGFVRDKNNKCVSADKAAAGGQEEDICSKAGLSGKYAQLNELIAEIQSTHARFLAYAGKFDKEVNDRAADVCKNGIAAYCYVSALDAANELENLVPQVEELSTEIIMLLGICPGLAKDMQAEGVSLNSVVGRIARTGPNSADAQSRLAQMQGRLSQFGCDENEVRELGETIVPPNEDPDFLQNGGNMTEIAGDGVDNDADGLQDESVEGLAGFNVTCVLFDSGNLKDDVFSLSVSGYGTLGVSPKGGLRSFGLNLPKGTYTATVTVINAPDNIGTFTLVILENGKKIASTSGQPPNGGSVSLGFTVTGN